MRLKTLRKERPAFENEGAVINGSRMDLSNSELKPVKHRTNNTFALPTSLNISPADYTSEIDTDPPQPPPTQRRAFPFSTPSPYQAIEAAYLEHGIRIHLNPTTAAAVAHQQQQKYLSAENLNDRKSVNSIQRNRAFANRNPSRSSSALNYSTIAHDTHQDSRPFSALQQTSTLDFDPINTNNISYVQPIENQNSVRLTNTYCSSMILTSENSAPIALPTQSTMTNGTASREALINKDPDLAYMSSLLQTTSGDSYRDTIRRRAGLRGTFAVHRNPQYSKTANSKSTEKSLVVHSPPANHRSSVLRASNMAVAIVPTIAALSSKKIEKDILKHASRIRTNHIRDSYLRYQNSLRSQSQSHEHLSSVSHSPTRTNPPTKQNKIPKPSKSINLEPLEILLASPFRPLPQPPSSHATSLTLHNRSARNQKNINSSKKRTKSPKIAFMENNNGMTTNSYVNRKFSSGILNADNLSLMKTSAFDLTTNDKTRQSNSFDSGCYDRGSSISGDTHSITSFSINQVSSSIPSARLTSASTRRSNIQKKVSFEDQSSTVILTTATYV